MAEKETEEMIYNIFEPWKTLDPWQEKYINTEGNCFLLCGRQSGKTAAMSIKFGRRAATKPKSIIMMIAYTEKQAYNLFFKTLMYLKALYPKMIKRGKWKPTKHQIYLTNGSQIMCYAAGITGEGLRTYTLTDLVIDEAAAMSREVFIATTPMLSVTDGVMDLSSTPRGKQGYFFDCSDQCPKVKPNFTRFYVSAEDCPRHSKEFLKAERVTMTRLEYAQEYLAQFLDDIKQFFSDKLIKQICTLPGDKSRAPGSFSLSSREYFLGVDIARMGDDESTFEVLERRESNRLVHMESLITTKTLTTDTTRKILELNKKYDFKKIYIDTGGLGVGVFDQLLEEDDTKRKVISIDNATRPLDKDETRKKKLLKEDLYVNLRRIMERAEIQLLKDENVIASLKSVQFDQETQKIFGNNTHIAEGLIWAAWCVKDKTLKMFIEWI